MSTRCQLEFRAGNGRRTVYRHWDGYPSAVVPDLLAFLAWSNRGRDVEYEAANFLFWTKCRGEFALLRNQYIEVAYRILNE